MAKRGRKRGAKRNLSVVAKAQPRESVSNFATPRVHPASNDCYPLNKLCRLCLLSNTNMEPIFPYPGDKRLSGKIFQCTNLEIKENPEQGVPNSICGQCKKQLDQCYEFRLLCCKNDEILHNLHAILSPHRKTAYQPPTLSQSVPTTWSKPVVQVQKLDLSSIVVQTPARRGRVARKSFGEVPLSQLYTPSRRGHMGLKTYPQFTKELVVRLTPISAALIKKYKQAAKVTQTKAAMKSFPQPVKGRGRPPKESLKVKAKPVKVKPIKAKAPIVKAKVKVKAKAEKKQAKLSKVATSAAAKKQKAKRADFTVPPKKRKQNFETAAPTVATATCVLCNQTFNSVKSLTRHMNTHENVSIRVANPEIDQFILP